MTGPPDWVEEPLRGDRAGEGLWWLFADPCGLAARIAPHLAAEGARVELIVPGDRFDRTRERAWSVRPGNRADLASLLAATGKPVATLHLWSLRGTGDGALRHLDAFEARHDLAIRATLSLLRTLGENVEAPLRILIAAPGLHPVQPGDVLDPVFSALPGLCEAAALDHPHLLCRTLDLQLPSMDAEREAWTVALAGDLAAEALSGQETAVAFRHGTRRVRRTRPAASPDLPAGEPEVPAATDERSLDDWLEQLAGLPGAPELPLARSPASLGQPRVRRRTARLDASSWKHLQERGTRAGLTSSGLLLAALSEVLATWSSSPRFTLALVGHRTAAPLEVDMGLAGGFQTRAQAAQEGLEQALEHDTVSGVRVGASWIDHRFAENEGELTFHWDVLEDLFPAGMTDAMWGAYRDLLRRLSEDETDWTAERLRLTPAAHITRRVFASSASEPLSHERLHTLFAAQARQHPDRPAVLAPSRTLTYEALFRLSNRLGRHLRELGAKPNALVAVVQEKGWEQIVSVLGILASGAAWLPADPEHPDLGNAMLALTAQDLDGLPDDDEPLDPVQRTTHLACVVEGVMLDHRGPVNTVLDIQRTWNVGPDDRVLALSSPTSGLSIWDLFGPLAAGGAIVLPSAGAGSDPRHWLERLREEKVTVWNTGPDLLRQLLDALEAQGPDGFESPLRLVLLSGDPIPLDLPDRLHALSPHTQLVRLAGATEASLWSLADGRPMANQTVHVLDDRMEPRPDWAPGHLYLGGTGLARGYWRDPATTEARFVHHPETGERLFRTGVLARAMPDGTIERLGGKTCPAPEPSRPEAG